MAPSFQCVTDERHALADAGTVDDDHDVRRWDPLNERQLHVLNEVAGGNDLSDPDAMHLRQSARALQHRGLLSISKKNGVWRAQLTDVGQFYLDHGHHPDHPNHVTSSASGARRKDARKPAAPTSGCKSVKTMPPRSRSVVKRAEQLIEQLRSEGGTLQLQDLDKATRTEYRRIIHAAKQHKLVPAGHHLKHTGRDTGDLVIRLAEDGKDDETDWNRIRLKKHRVTTDPGLIFEAIEEDPANLSVTEESVPRAVNLIRALAEEGRQHGLRFGVNKRTKHPKVFLQVGNSRRNVTVIEEYDKVPHTPTDKERREMRRKPWHRVPEHDSVPSGRLKLQIEHGWNDRQTWVDTKRTTVEKQVRRIIRDIQAALAEAERKRQEWLKEAERQRAERQRQEAEKRARWQAAMDEARVKAVHKLRKDTFGKAFDAWLAARDLRAFCAELEQATTAVSDDARDDIAQWIAWGRSTADDIDPITGSSRLANATFDIEPRPDDLRPFLGDWSPHKPNREYHTERDEKHLEDIRTYTSTWHPGMRGRPNWWRR